MVRELELSLKRVAPAVEGLERPSAEVLAVSIPVIAERDFVVAVVVDENGAMTARLAVARAEPVVRGQMPIEPSEIFVILFLLISGTRERAGLVSITSSHAHEPRQRRRIRIEAGGGRGLGAQRVFVADEKEKSVAHKRPAERDAAGLIDERIALARERMARAEVLVAVCVVERAMRSVGAAFGDGVDRGSGEAAAARVVGRDFHGDGLEGFEGKRISLRGLAVGFEAEDVVQSHAIDLRGVVAAVLSGGGQLAVLGVDQRDMGIGTRILVQRPVDRRSIVELVALEGGACARRSALPARSDDHRSELHGIFAFNGRPRCGLRVVGKTRRQRERGQRVFAERELERRHAARLMPRRGNHQQARPTDGQPTEGEAAMGVGQRPLRDASRLMAQQHLGAGQRTPLRATHFARERGGRFVLRMRGRDAAEGPRRQRPAAAFHADGVFSCVRDTRRARTASASKPSPVAKVAGSGTAATTPPSGGVARGRAFTETRSSLIVPLVP